MKTHQPNIPDAVSSLIHIIDNQECLPSSQRNSEVLIAARNGLNALIGTRQLPKAKAWLQDNCPHNSTTSHGGTTKCNDCGKDLQTMYV